jgi:dTDP-4-amino-4,6-dideoxygalactose transaminase
MDEIMAIAQRHNLLVIEDAAQGYEAYYKGRPLGSIGHFAAMSFHETKNVISGEGGALFVNDAAYTDLAEIIWEKGTDRSQFFRGIVDKYTWQHVGSSFLPGEIVAAFLLAQLEDGRSITDSRIETWQTYHDAFADLEAAELLNRPVVPAYCTHNAHMYYVILPTADIRNQILDELKVLNINAIFHYIPLHNSPAGLRYTRTHGRMDVTESLSARLLRLPMFNFMQDQLRQRVIGAVHEVVRAQH